METDHHVKLKEETKRIKAEQERAQHKFQDQLKHTKKEVILMAAEEKKSPSVWLLFIFLNLFSGEAVDW